MTKILTKQDILSARDLVIEQVDMSKWWPGVVCMRSVSAKERGQIEAGAARYKETKGKDDSFVRWFNIKLVALAACDEIGNRLFTDDEATQLAEKNAAAIAHLAEVAQRLAGLTKEDIEELAKNSEEAQLVSSSSV